MIAFLSWNLAIERIGVIRAGIIYNSVPLFASLEAALLLGEALTVPQCVGGLLIIGGICYASLGESLRLRLEQGNRSARP